MGKKSRVKKERLINTFAGPESNVGAMFVKTFGDSKFHDGKGSQWIVLNGGDQAIEFDEVCYDYWSQVCKCILGDEPGRLPEMAELGSMMNLSIFDVQVSIFEDEDDGGEGEFEIILLALYALEYVECFRWLFKAMLKSSTELSFEAGDAITTILGLLIMDSAISAEGSPKMRMAAIAARAIIERNYKRLGKLGTEGALCDVPFFKQEMDAFASELAAASERKGLDLATANAKSSKAGPSEPLGVCSKQIGTVGEPSRGAAIRL